MFHAMHSDELRHARKALRSMLIGPTIAALAILTGFFVLLGGWASHAPIASAALASGSISPEGYRRTVQHLEGGIIKRILVHEGARVEAGDALVIMEETQARSSHRVLETQHLALKAAEARLMAEAESRTRIDWQQQPMHPSWQAVKQDQQRLFNTRLETITNQRNIHLQRIAQLREEISGLRQQIKSKDRQLSIIEDEVATLKKLVKKGLVKKPSQQAMERRHAEVQGERAANLAAIARAHQSIGESQLRILDLDTQRREQARTQLGETRTRLTDLDERMASSRDVLTRTIITAPVSGTIFQLKHKTTGGVVQPGEPILEIVPEQEQLLVDARISPADIDVVQAGLPAEIALTAYPQRNLPRLQGRVRSVSADRIQDPNSGDVFYLARIAIDSEAQNALAEQIELLPGMSADTMIYTGSRTLLAYLTDPLLESMRKSLREE
uniref:Membrane fusion protein (MFP) family protein n=1 Tax=Magnetococcus massalia (strain MO-1) TaxID=451514 RepID=A0A1S7LCI7_MAGMO|nr:putative protease secretion protein [Candidatus Magnetococcus massalia]